MYLSPITDKYWAVDIETDGLSPTVIWVMCAQNVKTGEKLHITEHKEMYDWITERLAEGCYFVGHNFISFDALWLNRICGTRIPTSRILDTLIFSMVYSPSLSGGHSLDDWGQRLKFPKIKFDDWSKLSEDMITYCYQDVALTVKTFLALHTRMNKVGFTDVGLEIEHHAWGIIQQQKRDGFYFNIDAAEVLFGELRTLEEELKGKLHEHWPPVLQEIRQYSKPFKQDGEPCKTYEKHLERFPKVELSRSREHYTVYDYVEFDPASPKQRVAKLLEAGWEPREFTEKGTPQPTRKGELSPSLVEFVEVSGIDAIKTLAQWITINSRANMINTWMEAYNDDTHCIHGSLWLANTLRYRHSGPNTANIPRASHERGLGGSYSYESRELWTSRPPSNSRSLVGVDAKGIQLRVLANYLNNEGFTEAVLDGDPHSFNQQVGGFDSRVTAKTFIYAFLLGAGDEKVGEIIKSDRRNGKKIKARFVANFPGLARLLTSLERAVDLTGRIILCDGTPLRVTAPHTRLGYLLQGDESRIMKKAQILVAKQVRKEYLDVIFVGNIHDEWQCDVLNEHVDRFIEICKECFKQAGEFFNYKLPIDCDAKVGKTWAETH